MSRFHLEAGIAAVHAGGTDWPRVLELYDELMARFGSPVAALNRAVAVLHVHGAEAAEQALEAVRSDPNLASYAPLHAVAAELARVRGDGPRAAELLDRALTCPCSEPQRRFLQRRREALVSVRIAV